jgi:hypothetical protein
MADTAAAYTPKGVGLAGGIVGVWVASPNKAVATGIIAIGAIADFGSTWWDRFKQRKAARNANRRAR